MLDAVEGIPGKSGNGFRQDKVYFLFPAQLYHLVELFSFLGAYAGYSIVCENPRQLPTIVMGNFFGIIVYLHFEAVLLFFFLSADSAVGCYGNPISVVLSSGCHDVCASHSRSSDK